MSNATQKQSISPIYILCIPLSIPIGIWVGFQFEFDTLFAQVLSAGLPPLLVVFIAFFHTRSLNKNSEG